MTRRVRDRSIAQAYFFGSQARYLARLHGLTQRRILQIVAEQRALMRTPETRRDAWRAWRRQQPARRGRPCDPALAALSENERKLYGKISRGFGAAYARELLGLSA